MSRPLDYHARAFRQYRIELELQRAIARGAMVRGDRRDSTLMARAELDRADRILPRERILMDLADLAEFDRLRKPVLTLELPGEKGRVWP